MFNNSMNWSCRPVQPIEGTEGLSAGAKFGGAGPGKIKTVELTFAAALPNQLDTSPKEYV